MATRVLSPAGDFHDAQFLGSEGSHGAGDIDGYVPEEYFHVGRGTLLFSVSRLISLAQPTDR